MKLTLTDQNFAEEIKKSTLPVMVDFWAGWCGPCQMMEPHVEALATELDGKAVIAKLDVDVNTATAEKFGVMSIPTTIIFKNGVEVKRLVGYHHKQALLSLLTEVDKLS